MASKYHAKRESWGERSRRRERAKTREQARAKRSDIEQLALLDERQGNSKREREKLAQRIVENAKAKHPRTEEVERQAEDSPPR